MNWMLLALGIVIGMIGGAAGTPYLGKYISAGSGDVLLSRKNVVDKEDYVLVYGTLAGPSGFPNNSATIICYKHRKECSTSFIRQVERNTIGPIDGPYEYAVREWTSSKIIAGNGYAGCARTTITINRMTKEVRWVNEPVNLSQPQCADADTQLRKYSVEDSPGWRKMLGTPALQK